MTSKLVGTGLILGAGLLGLSACATEDTAMQPSSGGASMATTKGEGSEALSDSLKSCLARIPKDSSPGAKMVAEESCRNNEDARQAIVGTATTKSGDRPSAGTQGDSLEACMARIPKDATAGQRMLAEATCERDKLTHQ